MTVESGQPEGAVDSYARAEQIGFGILLIGAPLLMLGAAFFHPPHGVENGASIITPRMTIPAGSGLRGWCIGCTGTATSRDTTAAPRRDLCRAAVPYRRPRPRAHSQPGLGPDQD
jgi:hypothetical protein